MMGRTNIFIGTELKLNIHIDPMSGVTMDDYDFEVELRGQYPKNTIIVPKADTIRVDSDNYIVRVDTNKTGTGELRCKIIAQIPDDDFPDGYRTEIAEVDSGISIVRGT